MALLVIGLLVLGYTNLSSLEQQKEDSEGELTALEYMRKFEQFNRTLYGSELLSLANLQEDYNNTDDVLREGYDRISINTRSSVIVNSSYFAEGTYSLDKVSADQSKIEKAISNYEKARSEYKNRSVKYYSSKRYREIATDFGMNPPSSMPDYDIQSSYLATNSTTAKLLEEIQDYKDLTTIYNEFRTGKRFRCTNVVYNDENGRISSMIYEEI